MEARMTSLNENDSWKDHIDTELEVSEQTAVFDRHGFNTKPLKDSTPVPELQEPSKELIDMLDEANQLAAQFANNRGILKEKIEKIIVRMDEEGLSVEQQKELLKNNFRPLVKMSESWYYEILKGNGLGRKPAEPKAKEKGKQHKLPKELQAMELSKVDTKEEKVLKEHTVTVLECHKCIETMKYKRGLGPIDTFYECPKCKCSVRLLARILHTSPGGHFESVECNLEALHRAGLVNDKFFKDLSNGEAAS